MAEPTMSVEEQAARMVVEDLDPLTRKVHEISGTPYGVSNLSPRAELWAWNHADPTVNPDALRAQGLSEPEIGLQMYPLRQTLMQQAGLTFDEQHRYADRMQERSLQAASQERPFQPPDRPEEG